MTSANMQNTIENCYKNSYNIQPNQNLKSKLNKSNNLSSKNQYFKSNENSHL